MVQEKEVAKVVSYLDLQLPFEPNPKIETLFEPIVSKIKVAKPKLKELPSHLWYAFLGDDLTYPVIMSSALTSLEEEKLLMIQLKLEWSISNIKGISTSIVMHKIIMEELYKSFVEPKDALILP